MSQQDQIGVPALKLLAEEWMVAILHGLAEGARRPAELERGLPDGGHSLVICWPTVRCVPRSSTS